MKKASKSEDDAELMDIPPLRSVKGVTIQTVATGLPQAPQVRLRSISPREWEEIVQEWAHCLFQRYRKVRRCGGPGDQGRDVVAYPHKGKTPTSWHNFQCKYYDHPLQPDELWLELGKVCHYTFTNRYTVPDEYYFVAPQGVGPTVLQMLEKPEALREKLLEKWKDKCETHITTTGRIALTQKFRTYVEQFDFTIFRELEPLTLLNEYRNSPHYIHRFGGGLPPRPEPTPPPPSIQQNESRYVRQLLNAYGDCMGVAVASPDDLQPGDRRRYRGHFERSRVEFYSAESLRTFSRETLPAGVFEKLQAEILSGVINTAEGDYLHGFARVVATVNRCHELQLTSNPLITCMVVPDRGGICHQLANEDRLMWVTNEP